MPPTADCFHCGEALPRGPAIVARVGTESLPVCCLGCKAVAEFIDGNDLGSFYRFRSKPQAGMDLRPETVAFLAYDASDMRARYVHATEDSAEATIDIGGMYCSACAWLLDAALGRHPAIRSVDINAATHRAVIAWDSKALPFSELLSAIADVGFKPQPVGQDQQDASQDREYRLALKRLIVAAAAGMQVMMFAVALYAGDYFGIEPDMQKFLRLVSLLVSLPIVFFSATPFFRSAWRGIRARMPGMDLPVSIAIIAAFAASLRAVWLDSGHIYLDSVAMFVAFLSATRFMEMRARHRSDSFTLALARLLPDTAIRVVNGAQETVALDSLRVGDTVVIRPGDVIPADGEMISGKLSVDESLLTGESLPVTRETGMPVYAGGSNRVGSGYVRVTLTGASTNLAGIGRLLERAKADRPPLAVLADRVASRFVIAVLLIATLTGLAWYFADPSRVFEVVLATLVVTCPCALALATPAALAAAASRLAASGFLLVRSRILEVMRPGATIVFDKTGTLTRGRPAVLQTRVISDDPQADENYCRGLAAALEATSEHILARAFADARELGDFDVQNARPEAGKGVEAVLANVRYRIGSFEYVQELAGARANPDTPDAMTRVYLGSEAGFLAEFVIGDELRADARQAIDTLRQSGYRTVIASGDRSAAVADVAGKLGIEDWHAALTPTAKLEFVESRRRNGETVIMVGDGINDAPVLAAADASIALDAGTALARASADAIALGRRLMSIVDAAEVADKTRHIVRQNMAWAIAYNLAAVPLAATGMLAPWMAALGMSASSLVVVLNALRLHRHGRKLQKSAAAPLDPALPETAAT
ncbi:MAG: heavy metal translocating P-type ATPase [Woeseia sp.]